jgi:hypothetical protein
MRHLPEQEGILNRERDFSRLLARKGEFIDFHRDYLIVSPDTRKCVPYCEHIQYGNPPGSKSAEVAQVVNLRSLVPERKNAS